MGEVPDRILDSIEAPCDVKTLDDAQLGQLADEIREELISTVSQTGGHLAPESRGGRAHAGHPSRP